MKLQHSSNFFIFFFKAVCDDDSDGYLIYDSLFYKYYIKNIFLHLYIIASIKCYTSMSGIS